MAQWLGLCAFTAKGTGSIPGQGTTIAQAAQHGQKKPKQNKIYSVTFQQRLCSACRRPTRLSKYNYLSKLLSIQDTRCYLYIYMICCGVEAHTVKEPLATFSSSLPFSLTLLHLQNKTSKHNPFLRLCFPVKTE